MIQKARSWGWSQYLAFHDSNPAWKNITVLSTGWFHFVISWEECYKIVLNDALQKETVIKTPWGDGKGGGSRKWHDDKIAKNETDVRERQMENNMKQWQKISKHPK